MKRTEEFFKLGKPLASLSEGILYLAGQGHERLTVNQAGFFLIVATAEARGSPLTLQEILHISEGVIGRSIQNSYKVLLEPRGRDPKEYALGWISREADPDDERRKFLRLTPKGRKVAATMLSRMQLED